MSRRGSVLLVATASVVCGVFGCGSDPDPYPSYQACFEDRMTTNGLVVTEAIVQCCQDAIAGMTAPVCGTTVAACTSYLATHLNDLATSGDKSAGCEQYLAATGH